MVQTVSRLMTFPAFLAWKPDNGRYELHDGVVVEMQPTGLHEQVIGFLNRRLNVWLDQQDLPYFIPNTALIQPLGKDSGYKPDILLLDPAELQREPFWERESVVTLGSTVKLVVEVISTNWSDDYARKFEDYEAMGIQEYWMVDYLGLGGRRYIGTPKRPTITVCNLVNGMYEVQKFREGSQVKSQSLPQLILQTNQVLAAGQQI